MTRDETERFKRRDAIKRGRARLMLRLPSVRQQLHDCVEESIEDLIEAYEIASATLECFRQSVDENMTPLIQEYEAYCYEIEDEIERKFS